MHYVAVQVLTGYEAEVAKRLSMKNDRLNLGIKIVVPERFVFKYGKNRRTEEYENTLKGYIFVGFVGCITKIYHHVKQTFGVVRLLVREGDCGLLSEEEVKKWNTSVEEKIDICVEVDDADKDLARFMAQIEKCREYVERKRNKVVRWFVVSLDKLWNMLNATKDQINPKYVLKRGEERFRNLYLSRISHDFEAFMKV